MKLRGLLRKTSTGNFIPEIDGLRFFAILLVLTSHSWGNWVPYSGNDYQITEFSQLDQIGMALMLQGKLGVFLFFVISGFILALPWARHYFADGEPVNIGIFYWRRVTRLEPPYVIVMTVYFIGLCAIGRLDFTQHWVNYIASLFYMHNIIFGQGSVIYPAAWSLEIEFQFYVLAPLIFSLLYRQSVHIRRICMLFIIIAGAMAPSRLASLPESLLNYSHFFMTGVLLADLFVCRPRIFSNTTRVFDVVAVVAFALILLTFKKLDEDYVAQLGYALGFTMLFFAAFNGDWFKAFVRWSPVYVIGGMCYSIYLTHARVMTFTYNYLLKGLELTGNYLLDHMIINAAMIPLAVGCAGIFFVFVERPTMDPRWPQKLAQRFRRLFSNSTPTDRKAG